jgi:iron complex transport system ATP-binding protein
VQPGGSFEVDTNLTLREVVLTGFTSTLVLRFDPDEKQYVAADRMLQVVGLEHLAQRKYGFASSGERVRSLIARALLNTPKLLILDEPTSGLDLLGREQLLSLIDDLRHSVNSPDLTILMITHHTEELPSNTSHVLLLQQGRGFASGPIDQTLTSVNLSSLYRVPIRVHQESGRYYTMVQNSSK